MGNIRHCTSAYVEVTVGGHKIGDLDDSLTLERAGSDFSIAVQLGMDRARQEDTDRRDAARWAAPLDEGMSKALREVHALDMPGAEKLAAIQALQRVMTENHCAECGGDGWVIEVMNRAYGNPAGEQEQVDCPSCNGGKL